MQKKTFESSEEYLNSNNEEFSMKFFKRTKGKIQKVKSEVPSIGFSLQDFLISAAKSLFMSYNSHKAWKYYLARFPKSTVYLDNIYKNVNVEIGDYSSSAGAIRVFNPLYLYDYTVKIGSYTQIGSGLQIIPSRRHTPELVSSDINVLIDTEESRKMYHQYYNERYGDVEIGNDVWIGNDVTVLGGVTIGDGAVIGAKSLVRRNVKPYSITAGLPAKHIQYRFAEDKIVSLLNIRFWDFPKEKIAKNIELFYDVDKFIERFEIPK